MDGLEDAREPALRVEVGARGQAERALECAAEVGQDIAEQVARTIT